MIAKNNDFKKENDSDEENDYLISSFVSEDKKEECNTLQPKISENDDGFEIESTNQEDFLPFENDVSAVKVKDDIFDETNQENTKKGKRNDRLLDGSLEISDDLISNIGVEQDELEKRKQKNAKKLKISKPKSSRKRRITLKKEKKIDSSPEEDSSKSHEGSIKVNVKGKKEKKIKDSTDEASSDLMDNEFGLNADELKIFNFFYTVNRPVNNSELSLNFKKTYNNSALLNIINALEKKELLIVKLYSKSKIYMISSKAFGSDKLEKYKKKIEKLNEKNKELTESFNSVTKELNGIRNMVSEEEIEESIESANSNILACKERIKMIGNGNLVSKKELQKVEDENKRLAKILKGRKKVFNETLETLLENMNLSKKVLLEELGIEL